MNYDSIINKLERADGPDRYLDLELEVYYVNPSLWTKTPEGYWQYNRNGTALTPVWIDRSPLDVSPRYTESLDVVLSLIKDKLPEANCAGYDKSVREVEAYVSRNCVPREDYWYFDGIHRSSIPIAFLIAMFKALKDS